MRRKRNYLLHSENLNILKKRTGGLLFSGMFNKWVGGGLNLIGRGRVIKDGLACAVD